MPSATTAAPGTERIASGRLWWVGLLAVIASAAANEAVRTIAVALFAISPQFAPLTRPPVLFWTFVGVTGAVIAFAVVGRYAARPIRTFTRIAAAVLVLSWLPNLWMLAARPFPGTTVQSVGTLMFMHVVAAALSVGLLTTLGREK